jgi:hypothetical protein
MRNIIKLICFSLIIYGCTKKETIQPTSFDTAKLINKWWYLPYGQGTINYKFNDGPYGGSTYIVNDYPWAINGGINYKWKSRNDSLIILAGWIGFSDFEKWKIVSINDSILTYSIDTNLNIMKTHK